MRPILPTTCILVAALHTSVAAMEIRDLARVDAHTVSIDPGNITPAAIWISRDDILDPTDEQVRPIEGKDRRITLALPATERRHVLLQDHDGLLHALGERVVPLQQASNFRDIGGYTTSDGRTVRWGRAFRSGAMPHLTETDIALVRQLGVTSVVDLRSIEEREVLPNHIDDELGAMFVTNDYSIKPLLVEYRRRGGEHLYAGMEKILRSQLRSLYRLLIADNGAVVYHCAAGQDRTGVATALLYDLLGVDRDTILKDYHLSTDLRRPRWEVANVDPKDFPGNPLMRQYSSYEEMKNSVAEPLYTPSGTSHLAQFFEHIDNEYGSSENFMKSYLGLSADEIALLRETMLQQG